MRDAVAAEAAGRGVEEEDEEEEGHSVGVCMDVSHRATGVWQGRATTA